MPKITVYREWTQWETDGDGNTVGDEPEVVQEREEHYQCDPDEIDQEEGLTAVDLAVKVLTEGLHVTGTSTYPWSPGGWYSASPGDDYTYGMGGASEALTAHLADFTDEQERAIFAAVSKAVPSMR